MNNRRRKRIKNRIVSFFQIFFTIVLTSNYFFCFSQSDRWQQRIECSMEIDFDVNSHQFKGKQKLLYHNSSPDTLNRLFYHLYYNAFQPNSMMDVRSRTIYDPDSRVGSRIFYLKGNEIGYHKIHSLKMDGLEQSFQVEGTILEVVLNQSILPESSVLLEMEFESQVPIQIRRTGRQNSDAIEYSMAQWYPKLCEYDCQGWHANPYIGREFYGVWGDYDVKISIDQKYVLGATGYLKNSRKMPQKDENEKEGKKNWHFFAPNVHDFVWAADPDYIHTTFARKDSTVLHFLYQENELSKENWKALPKIMDAAFEFANTHFGEYPYKKFSFIQGGDGAMEYPMATLIAGGNDLHGLISSCIHELLHSWYQGVLGTNESLYAWMDEGFVSYASTRTQNELKRNGIIPDRKASKNPFSRSYSQYINFARQGIEESLITHSDHFITNTTYSLAAYTKGAIFLNQLEYIIGKENFDRGLLKYFEEWKFKHPNPNDFIRVMEKVSNMELDWYKEYWIQSTHTIDYGIKSVKTVGDNEIKIVLEKSGFMPMPLDVWVTYTDGSVHIHHFPLRMMRGAKEREFREHKYFIEKDWPWTHTEYEFFLSGKLKDIKSIEIDRTKRIADTNKENDVYQP
ncbi:MAG: M1 family metallopeptidase [Bacteroidetes bacterium]|nr:M1 family metallopeptidase [Bacteroidota bacterium]